MDVNGSHYRITVQPRILMLHEESVESWSNHENKNIYNGTISSGKQTNQYNKLILKFYSITFIAVGTKR